MVRSSDEVCFLPTPAGWLQIAGSHQGIAAVALISMPPLVVPPVTLAPLKEAYRQLRDYFRGERLRFAVQITPRQVALPALWNEIGEIPFGDSISCLELASRLGQGWTARTVAAEIERNPLLILLPCHRVRGCAAQTQDGSTPLTQLRRFLVQLEGDAVGSTSGKDHLRLRMPAQNARRVEA